MIGKVLSYDEVSYVIRFTVPLYIEDAEAIPLDTWNKPNVGDEVYIFQDDDLFGGQYCYHKMGDRSEERHILETDSLKIVLNESDKKLDLTYLDKLKLSINLNSNKIKLEFTESELTINTKKIHLGDNMNSPAVLFDKYEKRFKDLYKALATHIHNSPAGPTSPPSPPELVKFSTVFPNSLSEDKSNNVDIMK